MGLIKEPLDVDFVVDPRPLTDDERKLISAFIKADKLKRLKKAKANSPKLRRKLAAKLKRERA